MRGRNLTANILACWKSGSSSMSDVGQWLPGGLGREIRRISDQSHHQRQPGGHEVTQSEGGGLARGLQDMTAGGWTTTHSRARLADGGL